MTRTLSLLHIANEKREQRIWTPPFLDALKEFGGIEILEHGVTMPEAEKAEQLRSHEVLLTGWGATRCPDEIARDRGNLSYICNITGELARFLPVEFIDAGIQVSNWGDYPANGVAEGAMALLLAVIKDMHAQINHVERNGWKMDMHFHGGTLRGIEVGIYGLGVIGQRFIELIRPFGAMLRVFDPYLKDLPEGCARANSLKDLFATAKVIVIHTALTAETRNSVNAELLALLPRHGVVINTARGCIIDQPALFRELESGRLRAGLDVLEPDALPDDHPARRWTNLILTAHRVDHGWPDFNEPPTKLNEMQEICIDNLRRYARGEKIRFAYDRERYLRST
ncbi:MAG: NAD(P)-dependent oxidoreductase [Candidatus Sumerlaeota bacterium]